MRPRFFVVASVVLVAAALLLTGTAPGQGTGPPADLTRRGQILWNFEALLHDTFGARQTCARGRFATIFAAGGCAPLAVWSPYFDDFRGARRSAFHLSKRRFSSGYFGNYPQPILVRNRFVACDRSERRFLIRYADGANFALDCLSSRS